MADGRDTMTGDVLLMARRRLNKEFTQVLSRRDELLQELFEAGIRSRLNLNHDAPLDVRAEQVRNDLEDLASDLEAQLPSLPRRFARTQRSLRGLAAQCNSIGSKYSLLSNLTQ